jgi:surface carbohydrate biosynthesis protein (TIGR04326 family)
MILWAYEDMPLNGLSDVWYWQSFGGGDNISSIPRYLEENSERFRGVYLRFIYDLAHSIIDNKSLVEHLSFGNNFSFWWMTLLAEKSPYKSPKIYDCLRLLVLEEVLVAKKPECLLLFSSDKALIKTLTLLCLKLNIKFENKKFRKNSNHYSKIRKVYLNLPYFIQALISLRHVKDRLSLSKAKKRLWPGGKGGIFILSYFIHLDARECEKGIFSSLFWGALPKHLMSSGRYLNWLHIFIFSKTVPSVTLGLKWLNQFNQKKDLGVQHSFVDSYLSLPLVIRALRRWLRLYFTVAQLRSIEDYFIPYKSNVTFWPMLKNDWLSSTCGAVGLANCLWVELFDVAMAEMPMQKTGLFLCENQGWERAFIHSWKKNGHGKLVGVIHATVGFWHLYNFNDPRHYISTSEYKMPRADCLAINGDPALNHFLESGYSEAELYKVEALRYSSYKNIAQRNFIDSDRVADFYKKSMEKAELEIIVLGDYLNETTHRMMKIVTSSSKNFPTGTKTTIKAHPGNPIELKDYPNLDAIETSEPLDQILDRYDVAIVANGTSAAIDAYLSGLHVLIAIDGLSLNLSPLRGAQNIKFFSDAAELAAAIIGIGKNLRDNKSCGDFFYLDDQLSGWDRLLNSV